MTQKIFLEILLFIGHINISINCKFQVDTIIIFLITVLLKTDSSSFTVFFFFFIAFCRKVKYFAIIKKNCCKICKINFCIEPPRTHFLNFTFYLMTIRSIILAEIVYASTQNKKNKNMHTLQ